MQWFSQAEPAQSIVSLILTSAVVMGSPGPATISVAACGGAFDLRRTIPYLTGIVLGTCAVLLAVAAGIGSAVASQPGLASLLLYLSAAYVLYLAFRIATAPPLAATKTEGHAPAFASGLLLAVANPKAYLAIAAVLAGTRLDMLSGTSETVVKIVVLTGMIVLIHVGWLAAGFFFAGRLRHPSLSRMFNFFLAAILVLSTLPAMLPARP